MPDTTEGNERVDSADAMRLILLTVLVALAVGLATGGSLREFPSVKIRWTWIALIGVAMQFLILRGTLAFPVLAGSFVCLLIFAASNMRAPGFALILIGLGLNAAVIGANQGMPVTQRALVASGQADTIPELVNDADGQKHFLADDGTLLLPLGDVIAIGRPIRQAISLGDAFVHLGIAWFIVAALRKPKDAVVTTSEREPQPDPEPAPAPTPSPADR